MSFLMKLQEEGQRARASLKKTSTIVTDVSGRRYNASIGAYEESSKTGFVEDTSPDPGLHECLPGLYIGSQDASINWDGMLVPKKKDGRPSDIKNMEEEDNEYFPGMREIGITHVLNLFSEDQPFADKGIHYLNWILMDLPEQSLSVLQNPLEFIQEAITQQGGKILVHCNAGVSRSTAVIVAYLIQYHGRTYTQSLEQVRTNRPAANPNSGFESQLKAFEMQCRNITD